MSGTVAILSRWLDGIAARVGISNGARRVGLFLLLIAEYNMIRHNCINTFRL